MSCLPLSMISYSTFMCGTWREGHWRTSCRATAGLFTGVASFDQHLATWRSNEVSALRLVEVYEYTWSVTCLFYAALHLIEAHLVHEGVATASHHERWSSIRRIPALQP